MKKISTALLVGLILLTILSNPGIAQTASGGLNKIDFTETSVENVSKKKISAEGVNVKAIKDFEKSFKNVQKVNWYKIKDGFMVYFYQAGEKRISAYGSNGNWIYNLVTYSEDKLPEQIWRQVKSVYYDCSINSANEIQVPGKLIYIIHAEDKKTFKSIRVCADEMDVIEEIQKN